MGTVHAKTHEFGDKMESDTDKIGDLASIPVIVDRVQVDGVCKTKNDILQKHLKSILSATNFAEMAVKSQEAKNVMEKLELFKTIDIEIDTSKGQKASENGYVVKYKVTERAYPSMKFRMEVGDQVSNRADLVFGLKQTNMFGRGETLTMQGKYRTNQNENNDYGVTFSKPLNGNPDIRLNASGFLHHEEYLWSSFKQIARGSAIDLVFPTKLGSHCLKWEGVWRDMKALDRLTPFAVREQSGHSLKSSIQHIFTRDKRDDTILPNKGYLVKLSQEYAGVGGDVEFLKNDMELQYNVPLIFDSVLQLSMAGGLLTKVGQNRDIRINDRYFLGGPLTLRGFTINGVGPKADGHSLGADAYWLTGLHLYTPLPFRPGKGGFGDLFRSHFFVTAGNLGNIATNQTVKENVENLSKNFRLSSGLGIVLRLGGIARIEVNYVIPVRFQAADSTDQGFQFGVGISFL